MRFSTKDLVLPLQLAESAFLEVLLSQFRLTRKSTDSGVRLEVEFNDDTPATWNRKGREAVHQKISRFDKKSSRYKEDLDGILLRRQPGVFQHDDPGFPFRWASAGALPILNIYKDEYYCLFYRDVFPIGWNIANGATDTSAELLNPLETLEREVGEELVIIDPIDKKRYVLEPDKEPVLDRPEFTVFRQLWREQYPDLDISKYEAAQLSLRWENGPDKVNVRAKVRKRVLKRELTGCFVNINAKDFGIELDKIARITVNDRFRLCDGEVTAHRALNRPVGLFRVSRLQKQISEGQTSFVPDWFFHGGVRHRGKKIKTFLRKTLLPSLTWRSKADQKLFKKTLAAGKAVKLCPAADSVIRRHMQMNPGPPPADISPKYDVFLSYAAPDRAFARKIYDALNDRKLRVYLSSTTPKPGTWSRPIFAALKSAGVFIGAGTQVEYFDRPWPKWEAGAFLVTHLPNETIIPFVKFVKGVDPNLLPLPIQAYEVINCRKLGFRNAIKKILRLIDRTR